MKTKNWLVTIEVYDDCDPKPLSEKEIRDTFEEIDLDARLTVSVTEIKEV